MAPHKARRHGQGYVQIEARAPAKRVGKLYSRRPSIAGLAGRVLQRACENAFGDPSLATEKPYHTIAAANLPRGNERALLLSRVIQAREHRRLEARQLRLKDEEIKEQRLVEEQEAREQVEETDAQPPPFVDIESGDTTEEEEVLESPNIYWRGRLGVGSYRAMDEAEELGARVVCVASDLPRIPGTKKRVKDSLDVSPAALSCVFSEVEMIYHSRQQPVFICCREGLNRSVTIFLRMCQKYERSVPNDLLAELRANYNPRVLNPSNYAVALCFAPFAGIVEQATSRRSVMAPEMY